MWPNWAELTHYGRSKDRICFENNTIDAFDIQEAVYSLFPVPEAWKVLEQQEGLHFLLDSYQARKWSSEVICSQLFSKLQIPVTVEITSLLDRTDLISNIPSVKPVYIQKLKDS
ncbi:hypothetical protein [Gracilibacillus boraciitolerans]|uniref:hypothetical protein n=1 Tax=Gracilibacillus boraciitolerans TaxID=307521 RepID=UPI001F3C26CF|nr:hypothetical protein [Gracilibacillus boraciitolerans]